MRNIDSKLAHLTQSQQQDLKEITRRVQAVFLRCAVQNRQDNPQCTYVKSSPVFQAPVVCSQFNLAVDASDVATGVVLLQEGSDGIDHPIRYFSRKFNKNQRNYSTIERECLALFLALRYFEVQITSSSFPIIIYSDHNPLVFLKV